MFELGWYSAKLFFKGKLIREPLHFVQQTSIGIGVGLLSLIALAQADIPLCIPITVSSLITGILMPFLLKDFKMK
ncbi:hypothetical protein NIES2109_25870 [Nostoc sp. HK-01]|uniref:Uncharacterized protein n=2 Tax=Nostocales TaxID=1161 RepID=A0A1Z4GFM5_9CYAN|nr:hypothetical protein [Nostoc cycadae]BAY16138.1 hypothetical protein NIES21_19610 [Anabaenopsis circularis NIES-21]BBD59796.1 hypothetical protein NIES2109_25870 [Nostoc sp. HK-01]GBE92537.1 hypothetical protein NCWK1_2293 [Nostoc cycadae WK-1]